MQVMHCTLCGNTFANLELHQCFVKDIDRNHKLMTNRHELTCWFVQNDKMRDLTSVDQIGDNSVAPNGTTLVHDVGDEEGACRLFSDLGKAD